MAKSIELNRVAPNAIPGTPGTRPAIGTPCDQCSPLFKRMVDLRRAHPDAEQFDTRCEPHIGVGTSDMRTVIIYPENGSEVVAGSVDCVVAAPAH